MARKIFIPGGAGFIGSAMIRFLIDETDHQVLNLDKLTYAGNLESLLDVSGNSQYQFVQGDVYDRALVSKIFADFKPDVVMHLEAESHVDRSIDGPPEFIQTNIVDTSVMFECAREYRKGLPAGKSFPFHHISTDEVYGRLDETGLSTEETAYDPSCPYSASKASSDHLVRAWHRTYGFPVLIPNCSKNYGPYRFLEKLIPLMILNALEGNPLPIYGNGQQIWDWLHVEDYARELYKVVTEGQIGETYNIGGHNEKTNLEVVKMICEILDELRPLGEIPDNRAAATRNLQLTALITERLGHDQRYAIDASNIQKDLGCVPAETFETGLHKTVECYPDNATWCQHGQDGSYPRQRLGVTENEKGAAA